MSNVNFRPRFKFESPMSMPELVDKIKRQLQTNNPVGFKSKILRYHLVIRYPQNKTHFWSPQLDINLEEQEDGLTLVRCLFGPAPTVWTFFMFLYSVCGLLVILGLMIGFSQQTLNQTTWAYWLAAAGGIGSLILFLAAQEGKKLANHEMVELKVFLDAALECDCLSLAKEE